MWPRDGSSILQRHVLPSIVIDPAWPLREKEDQEGSTCSYQRCLYRCLVVLTWSSYRELCGLAISAEWLGGVDANARWR